MYSDNNYRPSNERRQYIIDFNACLTTSMENAVNNVLHVIFYTRHAHLKNFLADAQKCCIANRWTELKGWLSVTIILDEYME
jgi:hypothetical protein